MKGLEGFVQTVLGECPVRALGACQAHEHGCGERILLGLDTTRASITVIMYFMQRIYRADRIEKMQM